MSRHPSPSLRHLVLVLVLGDQLDADAAAFDGFDPAQLEGRQWDFEADNRETFGRDGPGILLPPRRFALHTITREVQSLVRTRFASHLGRCDGFGWPVTRAQTAAQRAAVSA